MSAQHCVGVEHQPVEVLVDLRVVDQLADRAVAVVECLRDRVEILRRVCRARRRPSTIDVGDFRALSGPAAR